MNQANDLPGRPDLYENLNQSKSTSQEVHQIWGTNAIIHITVDENFPSTLAANIRRNVCNPHPRQHHLTSPHSPSPAQQHAPSNFPLVLSRSTLTASFAILFPNNLDVFFHLLNTNSVSVSCAATIASLTFR